MTVVSDSSPLISLASIGRLDLLQSAFGSVNIPQAVHDEIIAGKDRPGAREIVAANWIQVSEIKAQRAVRQLMKSGNLHIGESEAITLSRELKADYLLLDDRAARKAAGQKRIRVIGTLGVLLLAKTLDLIPAVEPSIRELLGAGKYIDPATYRDILAKAGEL
jgi:predicted nucleic acid-binding protein